MHCFISSMSPSPAAFRSNAVASKQTFPGNFFSVLPFAVFSIPFFSFFSSFEIRLLWPSDNGKSTWGDDGESRSWGFVAASRNTRASSSTCSFVFLFKRTNRRLNESIWACREWTVMLHWCLMLPPPEPSLSLFMSIGILCGGVKPVQNHLKCFYWLYLLVLLHFQWPTVSFSPSPFLSDLSCSADWRFPPAGEQFCCLVARLFVAFSAQLEMKIATKGSTYF